MGGGRVLEKFPDIVTRLAARTDRFTTALDCVDVAYIPDGILDELPAPIWSAVLVQVKGWQRSFHPSM